MTRYFCTSCEETFEAEPGDGPPRCPECLRQHGIEEVPGKTRPARRTGSRRRSLVVSLAIVGVGLAAAAGLWLHRGGGAYPAPGVLGILDPQTLRRTLEHRGVSDGRVNPFEQNASIKKLAARASGAGPRERAASLAAPIARALIDAGPRVDLRGTADAPVRTAAGVQAVLDAETGRKGAQPAVLSFELAAHAVAVLRAAGLRAVLCQAPHLKAKVRTGEISGGVGRYVAAVYGEKLGGKPVTVLDPTRALPLPRWAGGGDDQSLASVHEGQLIALDDGSAAAHLLALRAFRLRTSKPDRAYQLSEQALAAAAPSATLQLIRAKVLADAGGTKDAVAAAQKALAIRDGPAVRTLLGLAEVGSGSVGLAVSHLEQALQADPGYWPAHLALASILLHTDPARGKTYLDAGLKIAPDEPELLLLRAARLLADDHADAAVPLLERVVARAPTDHARLLLYRALGASGAKERAASLRQQLLEQAKNREGLERLLDALDREAAPPAPPPPLPERPPRVKLPDVKL